MVAKGLAEGRWGHEGGKDERNWSSGGDGSGKRMDNGFVWIVTFRVWALRVSVRAERTCVCVGHARACCCRRVKRMLRAVWGFALLFIGRVDDRLVPRNGVRGA